MIFFSRGSLQTTNQWQITARIALRIAGREGETMSPSNRSTVQQGYWFFQSECSAALEYLSKWRYFLTFSQYSQQFKKHPKMIVIFQICMSFQLLERHIDTRESALFVCLVFNGTSTQDRSICANCGRVKQTQLAKDVQRDTTHNSQYVTQCNRRCSKEQLSQWSRTGQMETKNLGLFCWREDCGEIRLRHTSFWTDLRTPIWITSSLERKLPSS